MSESSRPVTGASQASAQSTGGPSRSGHTRNRSVTLSELRSAAASFIEDSSKNELKRTREEFLDGEEDEVEAQFIMTRMTLAMQRFIRTNMTAIANRVARNTENQNGLSIGSIHPVDEVNQWSFEDFNYKMVRVIHKMAGLISAFRDGLYPNFVLSWHKVESLEERFRAFDIKWKKVFNERSMWASLNLNLNFRTEVFAATGVAAFFKKYENFYLLHHRFVHRMGGEVSGWTEMERRRRTPSESRSVAGGNAEVTGEVNEEVGDNFEDDIYYDDDLVAEAARFLDTKDASDIGVEADIEIDDEAVAEAATEAIENPGWSTALEKADKYILRTLDKTKELYDSIESDWDILAAALSAHVEKNGLPREGKFDLPVPDLENPFQRANNVWEAPSTPDSTGGGPAGGSPAATPSPP